MHKKNLESEGEHFDLLVEKIQGVEEKLKKIDPHYSLPKTLKEKINTLIKNTNPQNEVANEAAYVALINYLRDVLLAEEKKYAGSNFYTALTFEGENPRLDFARLLGLTLDEIENSIKPKGPEKHSRKGKEKVEKEKESEGDLLEKERNQIIQRRFYPSISSEEKRNAVYANIVKTLALTAKENERWQQLEKALDLETPINDILTIQLYRLVTGIDSLLDYAVVQRLFPDFDKTSIANIHSGFPRDKEKLIAFYLTNTEDDKDGKNINELHAFLFPQDKYWLDKIRSLRKQIVQGFQKRLEDSVKVHASSQVFDPKIQAAAMRFLAKIDAILHNLSLSKKEQYEAIRRLAIKEGLIENLKPASKEEQEKLSEELARHFAENADQQQEIKNEDLRLLELRVRETKKKIAPFIKKIILGVDHLDSALQINGKQNPKVKKLIEDIAEIINSDADSKYILLISLLEKAFAAEISAYNLAEIKKKSGNDFLRTMNLTAKEDRKSEFDYARFLGLILRSHYILHAKMKNPLLLKSENNNFRHLQQIAGNIHIPGGKKLNAQYAYFFQLLHADKIKILEKMQEDAKTRLPFELVEYTARLQAGESSIDDYLVVESRTGALILGIW